MQMQNVESNLPTPLARNRVFPSHDASRPVGSLHAAHVLVRLQVLRRYFILDCVDHEVLEVFVTASMFQIAGNSDL